MQRKFLMKLTLNLLLTTNGIVLYLRTVKKMRKEAMNMTIRTFKTNNRTFEWKNMYNCLPIFGRYIS